MWNPTAIQRRIFNVGIVILLMAVSFVVGRLAREGRMAIPPGARFVASDRGQEYHLPSCRRVRSIPVQFRVWFRDHEEARYCGCRACAVCRPDRRECSP